MAERTAEAYGLAAETSDAAHLAEAGFTKEFVLGPDGEERIDLTVRGEIARLELSLLDDDFPASDSGYFDRVGAGNRIDGRNAKSSSAFFMPL